MSICYLLPWFYLINCHVLTIVKLMGLNLHPLIITINNACIYYLNFILKLDRV